MRINMGSGDHLFSVLRDRQIAMGKSKNSTSEGLKKNAHKTGKTKLERLKYRRKEIKKQMSDLIKDSDMDETKKQQMMEALLKQLMLIEMQIQEEERKLRKEGKNPSGTGEPKSQEVEPSKVIAKRGTEEAVDIAINQINVKC